MVAGVAVSPQLLHPTVTNQTRSGNRPDSAPGTRGACSSARGSEPGPRRGRCRGRARGRGGEGSRGPTSRNPTRHVPPSQAGSSEPSKEFSTGSLQGQRHRVGVGGRGRRGDSLTPNMGQGPALTVQLHEQDWRSHDGL